MAAGPGDKVTAPQPMPAVATTPSCAPAPPNPLPPRACAVGDAAGDSSRLEPGDEVAQTLSAHRTSGPWRRKVPKELLVQEVRSAGARLEVGAGATQAMGKSSKPTIAGLTDARAGLRLIL